MNMPHDMDDADLYTASYFRSHYAHDWRRETAYRQEAERVKARSHSETILDIGCGVGGFMECFDGWKRYGIEPSVYASEIAREKGIDLGTYKDFEDDYFDVVIFRGTIQHIATPIRAIAEAKRLLKPGGLLAFLATPNTGGFVYRLFQHLPPLEPERNWCLFSDKELTNILKRFQFKNIEVLYPYLRTPYARPLKDLGRFAASLFFGYRPFAFPGNMMEIYANK